MIRYLAVLASFAALAAAPSASAATRLWPGAAPCNGSLQACIDGAADGDEIQIASATPVEENLSLLNRSLSLTHAPGVAAGFGLGRYVSVTSNALAGNLSVSLRELSFRDGYVFANYNGSGTAQYEFRGLALTRQSSDLANYLQVSANHGTLQATLYGNRLRGVPRDLNKGLITLAAQGGTLQASAFYNRVESSQPGGYVSGGGIFVDVATGGSSAAAKIFGNEVRGAFTRAGIFVSEGLFSSTGVHIDARLYNNVVVAQDSTTGGNTGISFVVNNGTINAQAINNTVTRCYTCLLVTRWGGEPAGTGTVDGVVRNNLLVGRQGLAYADYGGDAGDMLSDGIDSDHNLLDTVFSSPPGGASDIVAGAQLVSLDAPRLRAGSPAIDAADAATLGLGLIFNVLPSTDADGMRRYIGAGGDPDIGAYEFGDAAFVHRATAANTAGHISTIDAAATNGVLDANPFVTANFNGNGQAGVANGNPFGVYTSASLWRVFNEVTATAIAPGTQYNVLVAGPGGGRLVHSATAGNTSGAVTTMSASGLDNLPDTIVLATQNWSPAGIYNPHPVAVAYDTGAGRWTVVNGDGAAMPANAAFDIYFQSASPNAFRIVASAATLASGNLVLDHPLLNGNTCVAIQVSRVLTPGSSPIAPFDVYLNTTTQRWQIFSYAGSIATGDTYDVAILPRQVYECGDRLFADGFQ